MLQNFITLDGCWSDEFLTSTPEQRTKILQRITKRLSIKGGNSSLLLRSDSKGNLKQDMDSKEARDMLMSIRNVLVNNTSSTTNLLDDSRDSNNISHPTLPIWQTRFKSLKAKKIFSSPFAALVYCLIFGAVIWFIPPPDGLTDASMKVLSVFMTIVSLLIATEFPIAIIVGNYIFHS
jgi:hypothetical protein